MGANSPDSTEDYMASGTYTPTLTPNGGTTAISPTAWLWTRAGNGASPAAGDIVKLSGKAIVSRGAVGQGVVAFSLPFVATWETNVGIVGVFVFADGLAPDAVAMLDDANTGSVTITDLETNALVQIEVTYQTANAVDP